MTISVCQSSEELRVPSWRSMLSLPQELQIWYAVYELLKLCGHYHLEAHNP